MYIPSPSAEQAQAGLRALVSIHRADGVLGPIAHRLLAATQRHILHSDLEVEALAPIAPAELARVLATSELRTAFSHALVIHAFASGDAGAAQVALVEDYSRALGVGLPELQALRHYTVRRLGLLRFDVLRHMYIGRELGRVWNDGGVQGIVKLFGIFAGKHADPALAARYQALGDLPEGTLGHAYYTSIRQLGFSLPGEPYAGPELMVRHDMAHVLGGYGTTPDEELLVAAFTGGFRREDALGVMLFAMCQFDLGVQTAPVAAPTVGHLDPDTFFAAMVRGSRMTVDLFGDWDLFAVAHHPLDAVREQLGILPRSASA